MNRGLQKVCNELSNNQVIETYPDTRCIYKCPCIQGTNLISKDEGVYISSTSVRFTLSESISHLAQPHIV